MFLSPVKCAVLVAFLTAQGNHRLHAASQPSATDANDLISRCETKYRVTIAGTPFEKGDARRVASGFDQLGMPIVTIEFTPSGQARFIALQNGLVGKTLPICLSGKLLSEPVLAEPILSNQFQIAGLPTVMDASDLAAKLGKLLAAGPPHIRQRVTNFPAVNSGH
jgi:preprotein translocase subunit SecD